MRRKRQRRTDRRKNPLTLPGWDEYFERGISIELVFEMHDFMQREKLPDTDARALIRQYEPEARKLHCAPAN